MGLFLMPYSGFTVGGGVSGPHNVNDAGPPEANRHNYVHDLRRSYIRTAKIKPGKETKERLKKLNRFVSGPPGQLAGGNLEPPYAWGGFERKDWNWRLGKSEWTKRKGLILVGESERRQLRLLS